MAEFVPAGRDFGFSQIPFRHVVEVPSKHDIDGVFPAAVRSGLED